MSLVRAQQWEPKNSKSTDLEFFYPSRRLGMESHRRWVWNPSHSDGMAYSLLAHRLHGGTSCYVPSLTERSQSNLHSLADKQACRLASLDYHASACIFLRLDDIQHYALMICNSVGIDDIHALRRDFKSCIFVLRAHQRLDFPTSVLF